MPPITTFEDLECWKKSREETNMIYGHFRNCRDFAFRDQIQRASVSVMNNIAEGFGRWNKKEKIQFMNIANGSLFEVRSMIYPSGDQKYLEEVDCTKLLEHNLTTIKILQGFLRHLHDSSDN